MQQHQLHLTRLGQADCDAYRQFGAIEIIDRAKKVGLFSSFAFLSRCEATQLIVYSASEPKKGSQFRIRRHAITGNDDDFTAFGRHQLT